MVIDGIITLIPVLLVAFLIVSFLFWLYNDAESRGKPGLLIVFLVLITFPLGLLVWVVARPEKL